MLTFMFHYRFIAFVWNSATAQFDAIRFKAEGATVSQLRSVLASELDRSIQRVRFGPCNLEVPKKSAIRLLFDEVLNPFYIFQIFSISLWLYESYFLYSFSILFISTGSVLIGLYETI